MNFDIEITRAERVAADPDPEATAAVWTSAAVALRERMYDDVRVTAAWPRFTEEPTIRFPLEVTAESLQPHDVPAYIELFFHEAYLLFNIAVPGSFGGTITTSGGEFRVRELTLGASVFELGRVMAPRADVPPIDALPLADVIRWYDSLHLGTQQLATTGIAKALFHLLHLARTPDSDPMSLLRLTHALEALGTPQPAATLAIRDVIANGTAPLLHPMHDDALDPRVEDASVDWIDAADLAASMIVAELQRRVRRWVNAA
ncbi:MAG TPA: hypothetical protein VJ276_06365 [Thermoanaerobaculia bacterium]|nr:hypothetical protein [Thermoanaerobaculia bacterium]